MAHLMEVAEWRCALEEYGGLCVMMNGMMLMHQWSASSWDSPQKVMIILSANCYVSLVKKAGTCTVDV